VVDKVRSGGKEEAKVRSLCFAGEENKPSFQCSATADMLDETAASNSVLEWAAKAWTVYGFGGAQTVSSTDVKGGGSRESQGRREFGAFMRSTEVVMRDLTVRALPRRFLTPTPPDAPPPPLRSRKRREAAHSHHQRCQTLRRRCTFRRQGAGIERWEEPLPGSRNGERGGAAAREAEWRDGRRERGRVQGLGA
jgi:hypothetical protein